MIIIIIMSSQYQSTAKGRNRKAEGNFTPKVITITVVTFQTWTLCNFLTGLKACLLKKEGMADF